MVKKSIQHSHQSERGVVSIFVVIFSALLITIVTVGFVQLMIRNQQEASTADLSESAYDSAMAGVEDAKRALVRYDDCLINPSGQDCDAIRQALDGTDCSAVARGIDPSIISSDYRGTTVGDSTLNQVYTCAKLILDTVDYIDELTRDAQHVIPIKAVGGFSKIQVEWAGRDDASEEGTFTFGTADLTLPTNDNDWQLNRPAIVEIQLMQLKADLGALDSDHRTLALYPIPASSIVTEIPFDSDVRQGSLNGPRGVGCQEDLITSDYSCLARLPLPANFDATRPTYLRIATRYNKADYRVSMLDSSNNPVRFDNVQPEVDVTGRAGDVFRRVSARISPGAGLYPEAAIDISGNLCKTFFVTGHPEYYQSGECSP